MYYYLRSTLQLVFFFQFFLSVLKFFIDFIELYIFLCYPSFSPLLFYFCVSECLLEHMYVVRM